VQKGDTVIVTKLARLGRSLKSILFTVETIHKKSATLKSLDGGIDTSNDSSFARATVALLGTFAQLDRDIIVARTQERRGRAAENGVHLGRRKTIEDSDRKKIRKLHNEDGKSKLQLAKQFNVSRTTIYRILEGN
jgi:DNA invertase Pin-like site-specific DNA recombinase